MSPDEGGDPACWLHLFDDAADDDADPADDDPAPEPDAPGDGEPGGNFGVG